MKNIDTYDKTAQDFYEKTKDMAKFTDEQRNEFLNLIPKNGKILDLACGPGRDAKIISEQGYQVSGVDFSENMIKIAKTIAPKAEFKVMDMTKLDFPDNFFDGVWFNAGILTVEKKFAQEVISKIFKILKPKGILFINAKEGTTEGWEFYKRYNTKRFYAYYQQDELKNLLENSNFKVLRFYIRPQHAHHDQTLD
ncbi:MAG: class I SAM-dependent methyltransferase [Nanoarchaeota archaeon]|nr:class I SAM-dependent methyltransferase [Nanoarchaeota archaeon]